MIVYKKWLAKKHTGKFTRDDEWVREGWFLFGFIPLYTRDITARGTV